MSDPFVAEVRIFGFNFAPKGWAFCNGQLLPISQNTALFSLLGTMYGGDGKSTFALPDIQGSCVIQPGQGPGLSLYDQGQVSGSDFITLLESEVPAHSHALLTAVQDSADLGAPAPDRALAKAGKGSAYKAGVQPNVTMAFNAIAPAGGSQPHNNMMPYLTLNFCIAMQGVFPQRP
jgi:microcystin-dependent protein